MLVLSRKPGEKILIGDHISITVIRLGPNTVRLGIEAPKNMHIVREELLLGASGALQRPEYFEVEVDDMAELLEALTT